MVSLMSHFTTNYCHLLGFKLFVLVIAINVPKGFREKKKQKKHKKTDAIIMLHEQTKRLTKKTKKTNTKSPRCEA